MTTFLKGVFDFSVGDGDCGATVKRGAAAIRDALKDGSPLNDASQLCHQLAGCMSAMGGTSGAVYNIFFTSAASESLKPSTTCTYEVLNILLLDMQ